MTHVLPLPVVIETARLAAVGSYDLSAPGLRPVMEAAALSLARSYGTAFALISLVDANAVRVAGHAGLSYDPMSRFGAFCHHAIAVLERPLIVRDTVLDARFHMSPLVRGTSGIRSYAGMALVDDQGYAVGAVGVLHTSPLTSGGLPLDDLVRVSALVLNSLQERRSGVPFDPDAETGHAGLEGEQRSIRATTVGGPQLWVGIRTEGSGSLPRGLGSGRTVRSVAKNSPASQAGFRVGDVLLSISGFPMRRREDIEDVVSRCRAGDAVAARVMRGWSVRSLTLRLGAVPAETHGHIGGCEPRKGSGHGASSR